VRLVPGGGPVERNEFAVIDGVASDVIQGDPEGEGVMPVFGPITAAARWKRVASRSGERERRSNA
jgi:hypothetical protein